MKNRKGFTLVEVLAVITLLGVLLMIAVPSISKVLLTNKKKVFAEDALRFIALAEERINSDMNIELPTSEKSTIIYLSYLKTTEVSMSPFGTVYDIDNSFVKINSNGVYEVQLVACSNSKCYVTYKDNSSLVSNTDLEKDKEKLIEEKDENDLKKRKDNEMNYFIYGNENE